MKILYFILFIWITITILLYILCNLNLKEPLKWPPKKQKDKVTHRHPTVIYLNSKGKYKPQRHTHDASIYNNSDASYGNNKIVFSKSKDNNSYFKLKHNKHKKGIHYSTPLPVDKDKKSIDIRKNVSLLSRKLWDPRAKGSDAVGYIYTTDNPIIYKLKSNNNPNVPYGHTIYNELDDKTKKDMRKWHKGKKHHHYKEKDKGIAKGW